MHYPQTFLILSIYLYLPLQSVHQKVDLKVYFYAFMHAKDLPRVHEKIYIMKTL